MKRIVAGCMLALAAAGCCNFCEPKACENDAKQEVFEVGCTTGPIVLDGKLDDAAWAAAPTYTTHLILNVGGLPEAERQRIIDDGFEAAHIKMLRDDKYVYVGIKLDDADVISYVKKDQDYLFRDADTAEFFMYADDGGQYWEFYSTPTAHKTSFIYHSGGMTFMPELMEKSPIMPGFEVASTVQGTLNDYSDRDEGWTTELRIPIAELNKLGIKFEPGQKWRAALTRYNYSKFMYAKQFSSYPELPNGSFHARLYYAPVIFK